MMTMNNNSKPAPRPAPITIRGRPLPPEPCSPGEEGHLSKSLGDSFLLSSSTLLPLHRQISEVSSITYSGYLFKRSNRPFQQVTPFPLDSLEIAVNTHADGDAIEAEITPSLHPKLPPPPTDDEDLFLRGSLGTLSSHHTRNSNNNNHHFAAPHHDGVVPSIPMVPLLACEITGSISTKGTAIHEELDDGGVLTESARKRQQALEQSLNSAAAFFGLNLESAFHPPPAVPALTMENITPTNIMARVANGVTPSPTEVATIMEETKKPAEEPHQQQQQTRSSPIKMNTSRLGRDSQRSFDPGVVHRRCSAPCAFDKISSPAEDATLNSTRSRPSDYIDPKDGHLWRAKYCVLEDGILFFYRNAEDADSQEAKQERQSGGSLPLQDVSAVEQAKDLSKSPMASRSCLIFPNTDGSHSGGSSDAESTFLWEKRVTLNCVGAVRSAETEYGVNAFELLAVEDEDDDGYTNKLVLKALQQEEMNEWLFQFHRSLASFVRNFVDLVGAASPSYALGDIHHPCFDHDGINRAIHQSPLRSINMPAFSPRFVKNIPSPFPAALSHGHGRQRRRRKMGSSDRGGLTTQSVHSVPTTPMSQSPTQQFPFSLSSAFASSNLVTPLNNGDAMKRRHRQVPEPEVQRTDRQQLELESPELSAPQSANPPETERPPAPSAGAKYIPPHLRKGSGRKYVPPHLRKKDNAGGDSAVKATPKYVPPHLRKKANGGNDSTSVKSNVIEPRSMSMEEKERVGSAFSRFSASDPKVDKAGKEAQLPPPDMGFRLGGCADPRVISGSILDEQFIPKKASRVGPTPTDAYGGLGGGGKLEDGGEDNPSLALRWEIGAVSECGIRDSNEDSYFIANDLLEAFEGTITGALAPTYWDSASNHQSGLFAIFDGHCGNQAARFAAERLPHFLYGEAMEHGKSECFEPKTTQEIMHRAILKLDEEFCRVCVEDKRVWESGSTALVAMLADEHLVIASIGDCRGVLSRLVDSPEQQPTKATDEVWNELDRETSGQKCFWMEVTEVHSPSRQDEKARIEQAGGWTTTEKEIPIGQLQRIDFLDEDVRDILQRCFQINDGQRSKTCSSAPQRILQISRVCGELAVSRAIGDRDFKAAYNSPSCSEDVDHHRWECPLFLPYPDDHNRRFVGDLVSGQPDFQAIKIGDASIQGEFLLLACDGLWDVMDMEDAVRLLRDLLFERQYIAKQAAARLAELAIHLGSSDNITVIVIKFLPKGEAR